MSFWGNLAKIGGLVASPFTFGLSGVAGNMIGNAINAKDAVGAAGEAIGAANQAAGQNRQTGVENSLKANTENISGQSAYESELMRRAQEDADQRRQALKDVYRASWAQNPSVSPYNPRGGPKFSDAYMGALKGLETQGTQRLANGPVYDMSKVAPLAAYNPINIKDVAGSTGNGQGLLSKIAGYAGPGLSFLSKLMKNGSPVASAAGLDYGSGPSGYFAPGDDNGEG
jgi:hypothetical protein